MTKPMPQVREFMTKAPHTIGADITVHKAQEIMREFQIRHLPVQYGGKLVGVLSDRNIKTALASSLADKFKVEDIMMPDPFVVEADARLDDVVNAMAEEKYGCTIVREDSKVVGIFTTVDACRALRQVLETFYQD